MRYFFLMIAVVALMGCGTNRTLQPEKKEVVTANPEPSKAVPFAGRLTEKDLLDAANSLIGSLLISPQVTNALAVARGKRRIIQVGRIENRTTAPLELDIFKDRVIEVLLQSGKYYASREAVIPANNGQLEIAGLTLRGRIYEEKMAVSKGKVERNFIFTLMLNDVVTRKRIWTGNYFFVKLAKR